MPHKGTPPNADRCEAFVYDSYGRKIKGRCINRRHVSINGKDLCQRHAALEALHLALKAKTAKRLPLKMPALYGSVITEWRDAKRRTVNEEGS